MRRLVHLCWVLLLTPICSFAADKYWRASGTGNWNSPSSWSDTQGGPTGAAIPGAGDVAIFIGGATGGTGTVLINNPVTIQKIDIRGNFAGTFEMNAEVHLTGASDLRSFSIVGSNTAITTVINIKAAFTADMLFLQQRGTVNVTSTEPLAFMDEFRLAGPTAGPIPVFNMASGSLAVFGGDFRTLTRSTFNGNDGSTVFFQKIVPTLTSIQTVSDAETSSTFYDVVFDNDAAGSGATDNTVRVTLGSYRMNVRHNVTIESGIIRATGSIGGINLGGDLLGSGNIAGAGTNPVIEFVGTGDQHINLSGGDVDKLDGVITVNKPSGGLYLSTPVRLDAANQVMNFLQGVVYSTTTNSLTYGTSSVVTGASNASYVDGPVIKLGNPAFSYPVGNNGYLGEVRLSGSADIDAPFPSGTPELQARYQVRYFHADPGTAGLSHSNVATPLTNVSECEYWSVTKLNGNAVKNAKIWLSYDSDRSCGITDPSQLRVAHWVAGSSQWQDRGNTLGSSGGKNFVGTTNLQSTFPFYTLASLDSLLNPLPVNWLNFTGRYFEGKVDLNWETALEKENDVYTVERAANGHTFDAIGTVAGKGTISIRSSYAFTDNNPLEGDNYYRIKQTDFDGKFTYSAVIRVFAANGTTAGLRLYPNPVISSQQITLENTTLRNKKVGMTIISAAGVVVNQGQVTFGSDSRLKINTSNLTKGSYFIRITDGDKKLVKAFIVQ